jgi:hypothetical protein
MNSILIEFFAQQKLEKISNCVKIDIQSVLESDKMPKLQVEFDLPPMIKDIIKYHHFTG